MAHPPGKAAPRWPGPVPKSPRPAALAAAVQLACVPTQGAAAPLFEQDEKASVRLGGKVLLMHKMARCSGHSRA